MAKFDIETLVTNLEAEMKIQLAARITAINTEKGDSLLDQISSEAWFAESLDDKAANFKTFVFWFTDSLETRVAGNQFSHDLTLEFDILLVDRQDRQVQKRIYRYRRALAEAIASAWQKVGMGYGYPEIQSLNPVDVRLNNSSTMHKLFGVSASFSIG